VVAAAAPGEESCGQGEGKQATHRSDAAMQAVNET
jgi:hypothetical protein